MPVAWRIVKHKYSESAFDGEGARRYGGRWTRPGIPAVYLAGTASGALLEILVHGEALALLPTYRLYRVEFPDGELTRIDESGLPATWRSAPAPSQLADLGDAWASGNKTLALAVPSAIMPVETNYVVNPRHPNFESMRIEPPIEHRIDTRIRLA